MAEILPIRRKTLSNQLINQYHNDFRVTTISVQNDGAVGYAEEENRSLGAALGAVFAVLILGAILGGIAFYLIR